MNDHERFERLASMARCDQPPALRMRDAVLTTLRTHPSYQGDLRGLIWVAAVAGVTAVPFIIAAALAWPAWSDPLLGIVYGGGL
ncbi:MAG: hypothetical protein ACUVX8_01655 [Candidatus Zipacnadales bacterium]